MPDNVNENEIESYLVESVQRIGGVCEKVTVLSRRGFFDRLIVLPGGFVVFVEVKKPRGGVISAHQKARHKLYGKLGAAVVIVRNREDIDRLLSAIQHIEKDGPGMKSRPVKHSTPLSLAKGIKRHA